MSITTVKPGSLLKGNPFGIDPKERRILPVDKPAVKKTLAKPKKKKAKKK